MSKYTKAEIEKAIKDLKSLLLRDPMIYTFLTHRSKNGSNVSVDFIIFANNQFININHLVSPILNKQIDQEHAGVKLSCKRDEVSAYVESLGLKVLGPNSKILHRWGFS